MPLKRFIFCISILFAAANAWAQDSTLLNRPLRWNLQQCIEYAKKNNFDINNLRLAQKTSQQELLLARAARQPDLNASASQFVTHRNVRSNGLNGTYGNSGWGYDGNYGANSSITIFNGGYINNNVAQKNLEVQSANLNIIQQENDITLQITQAYLAVLLDKENLISDTSVANTSRAQVGLEQKRFNVGSVARKDLIQLQAQQAGDEYNVVTAQNTERGDLLTLKQLLLLPTEADFDIMRPDTIIANATQITPLSQAIDTALKNRPEVKNGQMGVDIAQYDVKKAKAGYLPTLTGSASISSGYTNGQGAFGSQLNNNFLQQAGVTLNIPIFSKRVVKTQVEEAKISVESAQLSLKNTKITLSQSVERYYINLQNAKSQYDAAEVQFKFSQESYRIANEQLKVGVANVVDFLLQKTQYIQAQQAFTQAKYNVLLSLKIYDFYRGVPITL